MSNKELLQAVETILFTTPKPLPPRKIVELSGDRFSSKEIRDAIKNLNQQFKKTGRVFRIEAVGDGFQMRTLTEFGRWVQKLETVKTIKLSMATMETLSIIAYKQPVTRAGIEFIRGVDSSHTVRRLMQQKLIRIVGREMIPGRPSLYGTTKYFLEIFGLTHLKHLPALAELEKEESASEQLEIPLEEDEENFSDSALEPASGLIGADEPPDDPIKDDQDGEEEIT